MEIPLKKAQINPNQVYDDISEAFEMKSSHKLGYSFNNNNNNSSSKVNEYCYIPANSLTAANTVTTRAIDIVANRRVESSSDQAICSSWLSEDDTQSGSHHSSPSSNRLVMHHHVTSTPCPPKTLPPSMAVEKSDDENCYDVPDRTSKPNEYKQCRLLEDEINETGITLISNVQDGENEAEDSSTIVKNDGTKEDEPKVELKVSKTIKLETDGDDENCEYQIPTNKNLDFDN